MKRSMPGYFEPAVALSAPSYCASCRFKTALAFGFSDEFRAEMGGFQVTGFARAGLAGCRVIVRYIRGHSTLAD
jgi:hypothetical protein